MEGEWAYKRGLSAPSPGSRRELGRRGALCFRSDSIQFDHHTSLQKSLLGKANIVERDVNLCISRKTRGHPLPHQTRIPWEESSLNIVPENPLVPLNLDPSIISSFLMSHVTSWYYSSSPLLSTHNSPTFWINFVWLNKCYRIIFEQYFNCFSKEVWTVKRTWISAPDSMCVLTSVNANKVHYWSWL